MRIPVVLATAHINVRDDGRLLIDVDGEPFAADRDLDRRDLSVVLDEITTAIGTAVRVEVRESDGTVYADIATPPDAADPPAAPGSPETSSTSGLTGTGFQPGEEVAVAYIVTHQTADAHGRAGLHLPPALASAHRHRLVLIGMTSQVATASEQPS